jgi:hypothetical protein
MCSPALVAGGAQAAGGAVGVYTAYQQSNQYNQQAGIYGLQGELLNQQADQFDRQAGFASAMGKYQANLDTNRAAQAQTQGELNQGEAAKGAQQVVGAGKTAFAANGVLIESRAGSAASMWEQDEAANLAYEQSLIKANADNEVFGYLANANMAKAQGAIQASSFRSQGAAARINAQTSGMQAGISRSMGRTAVINGWAGLLGGGASGVSTYASVKSMMA